MVDPIAQAGGVGLDLEELEKDEAFLPPAPWQLWTSCSFRRITGPDGKEGGVLHAYNQRSDGHPDLSMPEDQLLALVRIRNALPALIGRIRELEAKRDDAVWWMRWLVRQAQAPGLTEPERLSIIAHVPRAFHALCDAEQARTALSPDNSQDGEARS